MSDLLTHWAVFEDCRRLAVLQPDDVVDPVFRDQIEASREHARLGAITRGGRRLMPPVLDEARRQWRAGVTEPNFGAKVAFVLGSLTHQACDNVMKPLLTEVAGTDWNDAHHGAQAGTDEGRRAYATHQEISAYYDTHVFRQVYLAGDEEPFNRFLLAHQTSDAGSALEEFVRALFQRSLMASHTLKPDLSDPGRWLDDLFDRIQPLYLDIHAFVEIFNHPDPAKMTAYRVETDFYRADDPAVLVARDVQQGRQVAPERAREAGTAGANTSYYGRAVEVGLDYLRRASSFWRFETDELSTPNWSAPTTTA